ncbi:MAG: NAD(P)H-dependent glycerol-3-phosphate dehydrogenase [Pseudomonadota bacterium]
MKIIVLGSGAWGSALAYHFNAAGHDVTVWGRNVGDAPAGCARISGDTSLPDADLVVLSTPAQTTRGVLTKMLPQIRSDAGLIITSKGIERGTLALQSDIVGDIAPTNPLGVLTGPSFAADVLAGRPTGLTLACADPEQGRDWRDALAGNVIRVYYTPDVVGAQIGGAMKNVIAIACGIVAGCGMGASAQATVMTRGFAEMSKLGVSMGADLETLGGLSGLGDLALTCHSPLSRNYSYGFALGEKGKAPETGTFEGALTAQAALNLGKRHGLDLSFTETTAALVEGRMTVQQAMQNIFARPLKDETLT